jgi:radical SAM superfamily enzyme YgiQ (UPF0313 family)
MNLKLKKSVDELQLLRDAGLRRIHSGMESVEDEVLSLINKGTDREGIIRAGLMIKEAGIELSSLK